MKTRIGSLAGLAVTLAAAGTALPLPAFYAHHHAGDEHAHVHPLQPWGPTQPESDTSAHVHSHDGDGAHVHSHATTPELTAARARDHVHWQHPFQAAVVGHHALVVVADAIREAPSRRLESPAALTLPTPRSRGPPFLTFL